MSNGIKIAIVSSVFNQPITGKLLEGAYDALIEAGIDTQQIKIVKVPGAIEIPLVTQLLARSKEYHAIICLGAIIQGDTDHHLYVAQQVSSGVQQNEFVNSSPNSPSYNYALNILGITTSSPDTLTLDQAPDSGPLYTIRQQPPSPSFPLANQQLDVTMPQSITAPVEVIDLSTPIIAYDNIYEFSAINPADYNQPNQTSGFAHSTRQNNILSSPQNSFTHDQVSDLGPLLTVNQPTTTMSTNTNTSPIQLVMQSRSSVTSTNTSRSGASSKLFQPTNQQRSRQNTQTTTSQNQIHKPQNTKP